MKIEISIILIQIFPSLLSGISQIVFHVKPLNTDINPLYWCFLDDQEDQKAGEGDPHVEAAVGEQ